MHVLSLLIVLTQLVELYQMEGTVFMFFYEFFDSRLRIIFLFRCRGFEVFFPFFGPFHPFNVVVKFSKLGGDVHFRTFLQAAHLRSLSSFFLTNRLYRVHLLLSHLMELCLTHALSLSCYLFIWVWRYFLTFFHSLFLLLLGATLDKVAPVNRPLG